MQNEPVEVTAKVTSVLQRLKVQQGSLDLDYLRQMAKELKVMDLLERALLESQ
jgi:hypothetical protein